MGIQNRDYMKRPSDGDDGGGSENDPAAAKLERLFADRADFARKEHFGASVNSMFA